MKIDISKLPSKSFPSKINPIVSTISWDSRTIQQGDLYLPLVGDTFDGHTFINKAFAAGAEASICAQDKVQLVDAQYTSKLIIVEDALAWSQAFVTELVRTIRAENPAVKIAAVTGSAGKTTTREMLIQILSSKGRVLKTYKNYNTLWGNAHLLLEYAGEDYIVLEFGLGYEWEVRIQSDAVDPDVGAIVTIGAGHAEQAGGIEGVYSGKKALAQTQIKNGKPIILNIEDEGVRHLAEEIASYEHLLTVGHGTGCYMCAELVELTKYGTTFTAEFNGEKEQIQIEAIGKDYIQNSVLAIASAMQFGFTFKEAAKGLVGYAPYAMRFQVIEYASGAEAVNDSYNANLISMKSSIDTFDIVWKSGAYYRVAVLGEMRALGDLAPSEHVKLGEYVRTKGFDEILFVGEYWKEFGQDKKMTLEDAKKRVDELVAQGRVEGKEVALLFKASNGVQLYSIIPERNQPREK